ncbi:MAG: UDP-glucose 4-epimerase GalE [Dyella sp.]|uniref:UDP-glucose 4-epimerase GalE n=1 Tax=Dyella sp. TaxID=1869338 RepID=UPI003F7D1693
MRVLVTGGCGYIGSHTITDLTSRGHEVAIVDNFSNASPAVLERLASITGVRPISFQADIRDRAALLSIFQEVRPDAVIHFAALKSVGESWEQPLRYFDNNITGTIVLLQVMHECGVRKLVFSSSATVYGMPESCPISEDAPLRVTNPYGRTKLVMEELIGDLCAADESLQAAVLRYFNPVGAHPSGELGESPSGPPANLMPYICQVAAGRREYLNVFGNDYDTADGTGVRDYIHVMDLARAHTDALDALNTCGESFTVNLGTGRGYSVLELVKAFELASGRLIPLRFCPRRAGDVGACYADPSRAAERLGWTAQFDLARMCEDAWRWQCRHPNGI